MLHEEVYQCSNSQVNDTFALKLFKINNFKTQNIRNTDSIVANLEATVNTSMAVVRNLS